MPQSRHVAATDAPVVVEYLPAPQSRHVAATDAPSVAEYVPAPQSVQPALPEAGLYLPDTQATQVPPLGPVYPILQRQLVIAVDPATDCEYMGQLEHSSAYHKP
jgi:hypothetical protein